MPRIRLLLVDDDVPFLRSTERRLRTGRLKDSLEISLAEGGRKALRLLESQDYDVVVTDLQMPDLDGREVLSRTKALHPLVEVLILTGLTDVRLAVDLLKAGASDYLTKPVDGEELELRLERIAVTKSLEKRIEHLETDLLKARQPRPAVFESPEMQRIVTEVKSFQDSDFPVLILGESGTGKEVVAELIQRTSKRSTGPFVTVNCAGLVPSLLESEMFGYEKGAFTGAVKDKPGKFELADKGTLFLDEIGELDLALQPKLLRLLQQGTFERVGGTRTLSADVRILAATNRDLARAVQEGSFRADLYYRLNVIRLDLPPLRERSADILPLANSFLDGYQRRYGKPVEGFSDQAQARLLAYRYPGNVRELENIVARAYTACLSGEIQWQDLPGEVSQQAEAPAPTHPEPVQVAPEAVLEARWNLERFLEAQEAPFLVRALRAAKGNRTLAAEWLGISRRQLYNKLEKHGIHD